jgi:hypothetical protein
VVVLEINTEKTKFISRPCQQNVKQYKNLLIANKYFENVSKFMYL